MSSLYQICDRLTEALIYFSLIFGPWAFGTTQPWSIHVMNGVGLALGLLWLVKWSLRAGGSQQQRAAVTPSSPPRGHDANAASLQAEGKKSSQPATKASQPRLSPERLYTRLLAAGTILILLYCLVSAWNARAIYHPDQWSFEYLNAVAWLPHSYDQAVSWSAFWKYLALAGLFWALRDWLLTPSQKEDGGRRTEDRRQRTDDGPPTTNYGLRTSDLRTPNSELRTPNFGSSRLPIRLRRLFWILAINGLVLAIQGLMQREEGGGELLWLVQPHINKTADAQFGPYAYRANAAQYFNLLWPAVLGFWWASASSSRRRRAGDISAHPGRVAALLPCVLIMAICPFVTTSRGGAIVLVMNLILAGGILWMAQWRSGWIYKIVLLLLLAGIVVGGALLGWNALAPRMELIHEGFVEREALSIAGGQMARDNALFGTGPGTFETMYQLYLRSKADVWQAYLHNDWLETRITFGWVGATPVFLMLLLVFARWFWGGGIHGDKSFVMLLWVSLGGCMVHSWFDFPFQIHSVLTLFLVLCAVLSCLGRRAPA